MKTRKELNKGFREFTKGVEKTKSDMACPTKTLGKVFAEVWDDEREYEVAFNAAPWLAQASLDAIKALIECGWRGDYAADRVAEFFQGKIAAIDELFECKNQGFECRVDPVGAMNWLKANRKDVYKLLKANKKINALLLDSVMGEADPTDNLAEIDLPEKIVITVKGGMIKAVHSGRELEVLIIDEDLSVPHKRGEKDPNDAAYPIREQLKPCYTA